MNHTATRTQRHGGGSRCPWQDLNRSHPVVPRIVLDLRKAQHLQHRRDVHTEAPPQAFLQSVPSSDWILWGTSPGFDRAFGSVLLLVRAPERHPIAMLFEHFMEVVERA